MTARVVAGEPVIGGGDREDERDAAHRLLHLSPRELEVLMEVRAGLTSKEIAADLGISESTVNKHVTAAMRTLAARSRSHAAAILAAFLENGHHPALDPPADDLETPADFPDALVRVLKILLKADSVYVSVWDPVGMRLRVVAAVGPELAAGQTFESSAGYAGLAFQRDRLVSITDRARLRAALRAPRGQESGSAMAAPIRAEGSVVGSLAASSAAIGHFTALHLELLSVAAQLVGDRLVHSRRVRGA